MSFFDRIVAASLPLVPRPLVRRLSRRYIAGESADAALKVGRKLAAGGYRITFDILGEAVEDRAGVDAAATEYVELLEALIAQGMERNISLKPTQLGLAIDVDFCHQSVRGILEKARDADAFLRFEMEDSPTTDDTLQVFGRLRDEFGAHVGCVLQSMLRRTEDDAAQLLQSSQPLDVRLVKGIYVEPARIAFQDGGEVNDAYLRTLRLLLAGGARVGVATHDDVLVRGLKEILADMPEARARCEVQMLLGVREDLRARCRQEGLPVRTYVPYGTQWYPYVMRRLSKNPKLARYALMGMFRRREKMQTDAGI